MVISGILTYLSFEVSTKSRTIVEVPTQFPKMTICNDMPFQTEYAVDFLTQIIKEKHLPNIFDQNVMSQLNFSEKTRWIDFVYYHGLIQMNSLNDSMKKKLGHSLDNILISCMFNMEKCSKNDFEWNFHRLV